ncbi:deoxycytidylate deaminase-like [Hydractinia symbiolongicarpus]|uniref:deoxycytidylate deaminase-like n=1 Tax=Hydractinia symbiolongicarpus TaxID=13093 RepID=UPI00254B5DE4|nr:deoxycytidylate deaminase-like [Hydractinia symbiolongicarpus]
MSGANKTVSEVQNLNLSEKRVGYLEWEDYFMAIAFLSAQRSKDPVTQVGACIVNSDKKIVGIGYNGMPTGCSDDILPWGRDGETLCDTKRAYVCHAELNAVLNKNSSEIKGCTIYVALFPCNECAKVIIQSGIKEVVYYSNKYADRMKTKASFRMLDLAGIKHRQHTPKQKQIVINFEDINKNVSPPGES